MCVYHLKIHIHFFFLEFESGRGFSSASHSHHHSPSQSSTATYNAPVSYHSSTDAHGPPSDAYGAPSASVSDAYGAPESPVSNPEPHYSGHYTYDSNLTPSSQITYFDTNKQ